MALKGDENYKGKQTHEFKMRIRNLANFHASSRKYEKFHFVGLLLYKAYKVLNQKYWGIISNDSKMMMQRLRKNWHLIAKMTLVSFNASIGNSKNLHFDVLLLSICLSQKITGELRHNTEEWCKVWRTTDLHSHNDMRSLANFDSTLKNLKISF